MTRFLRSALVVALLAGAFTVAQPALRLFAQTALFTTSLSTALSAPAQGAPATAIVLTSGTNVAIGQGLFVDAEYMTIQSAGTSSTRWNVSRGQGGTQASSHAATAPVFFGNPNLFYNSNGIGPCTSTLTTATPRINVSNASIFLCPAVSTLTGSTAATWARMTEDGLPAYVPTRYTGWTYATAGAVTIQPGVQFIGSAGALSMTLAAPSAYMDGMVMILQASTAQAHTLTYTAGFYGTTTSSDVATFGGAIGDNIVIYVTGGAAGSPVWRIQSFKGITVA